VIFVLMIMAADNVSGAFGILIPFWIFYMAFDAYKTAQARMLGLPLPDPLGLDRMFGLHESQQAPSTPFAAPAASSTTAPAAGLVPPPPNPGEQPASVPPPQESQAPVGAIVLIALGVLFLLGNLGTWFNFHRFWPLFVIGIGLWLAYRHMEQQRR
jgi:cell wall-active antibiotic response 4TMS protein YvqF